MVFLPLFFAHFCASAEVKYIQKLPKTAYFLEVGQKTRNAVDRKVSRVRIPNSPPEVHRNFDRITVDFFIIVKSVTR